MYCLKRSWFKLVVLISPLCVHVVTGGVCERIKSSDGILLLRWFGFCFLFCFTKLQFVCEFGEHRSHTLNRQHTLHRPTLAFSFLFDAQWWSPQSSYRTKKQLVYLFTFHTFFRFFFPHFLKIKRSSNSLLSRVIFLSIM